MSSALLFALVMAGCSGAAESEKASKKVRAPVEVRVQTRSVTPCLMQGTERLDPGMLRAVGTEPFWAAQIVGRCVTYSHPDDPQGTRIWARYSETPEGKVWSGALNGRLFQLRIRTRPDCSDGMSDKLYPSAAELRVAGESRRGCAEPIR